MYRTLRQRLTRIYPDGEASAILLLVLGHSFGLSRTDVLMGKADQLTADQLAQLDTIICRLETGEPVQYVLGEAEFDGLRLHVAPGVLIPRPETEELVHWIVEDFTPNSLPLTPHSSLLDIGTGSGCIALALANRLPHTQVTAWDISPDALRIAADNAQRLGLNVTFQQQDVLHSSLLAPDSSLFDVIVSNPPYICESERTEMETNVLDHEPSLALFVPDDDPLLFYRAIATNARHMLRPGGALYFEINRNYGKETAALLHALGYTDIEIRKDFMDNDRMIRARWQ